MPQSNSRNYRERFAAAVSRPDYQIDVVEAALYIAGAHNPAIEIDRCRQSLTRLAEGARFRVPDSGELSDVAGALCKYLHRDQGFEGNSEDYYDPENSFLDKVLENRRGIPITLALVYLGVGRALGLDMQGVGFPGHFLVKIRRETQVIIDPYSGRLLSDRDCRMMLKRFGQPENHLYHFLRAVPNREILGRMLNNLKMIYQRRGEFAECLSCTEWRLILEPGSTLDILDKAGMLEQLARNAAAIEEFERFLELAPDADVAPSVREKIRRLKARQKPRLH